MIYLFLEPRSRAMEAVGKHESGLLSSPSKVAIWGTQLSTTCPFLVLPAILRASCIPA